MVKDAEEHAVEDKKFRELVDTRNRADAQSHAAREFLVDSSSSLADSDAQEIEREIVSLDELVKSEDKESIDKQTKRVAGLIGNAKEKVSKKAEQSGTQRAEAQTAGGDGVIDAEFEDASSDEAEAPH